MTVLAITLDWSVILPTFVLPSSALGQSLPTDVTSNDSVDPAKIRAAALEAMDEEDDARAFQLARVALRISPDDPETVFMYAMVLGRRQRFPEAIQMLDELAIKFPAVRLPVQGQTAQWMVQYGKWQTAEDRFRIILQAAPESNLVHRNLALLLVRQGRRLEATVHLRKLCQLGDVTEIELRTLLCLALPFPEDAASDRLDPIGYLGEARKEASQGNWDRAAELLRPNANNDEEAAGLLGRCLAKQQDFNGLAEWADSTSEPKSNHADYFFAMGVLNANRNDTFSAIENFSQAILIDQTDPNAYLGLSQSLTMIGETESAKRALGRSVLIESTQSLGKNMARVEQRDVQQFGLLIDSLYKLRRPMEALAWRGMQLLYERSYSKLTEDQEQQLFAKIEKDRAEILASSKSAADKDFLLCGVNLESLRTKRNNKADGAGSQSAGNAK